MRVALISSVIKSCILKRGKRTHHWWRLRSWAEWVRCCATRRSRFRWRPVRARRWRRERSPPSRSRDRTPSGSRRPLQFARSIETDYWILEVVRPNAQRDCKLRGAWDGHKARTECGVVAVRRYAPVHVVHAVREILLLVLCPELLDLQHLRSINMRSGRVCRWCSYEIVAWIQIERKSHRNFYQQM